MTKAPTPEEIEAVARVICAAGHDDWSREGVIGIDVYRDMATAAIQALRSLAPPGEDVAGLVAEARAFASMADRRNLPDDAALFIRLANALDNQHP